MQWQEISVNDISIRYLTAGSGVPLVLLHGIGDSAADWQEVVPFLARRYRVYAPDLPGHGRSTKTLAQYTPAALTHAVIAWLDALDLPQVFLVGHSLGGLLALQMALAAPTRVPALALMASGGLGRAINPLLCMLATPFYGEVAAAWGQTFPGRMQRLWVRIPLLFAHPGNAPAWWRREQEQLAGQPGFLEANLAILRTIVDWRGQRVVLLDQLPDLAMPTLLVWGTEDHVLPVSQARAALNRLPQGQMELVAGGGHLLPVECPAQSAQILEQFFQKYGQHAAISV